MRRRPLFTFAIILLGSVAGLWLSTRLAAPREPSRADTAPAPSTPVAAAHRSDPDSGAGATETVVADTSVPDASSSVHPSAAPAPYRLAGPVSDAPPPLPARYDTPASAENARRWAVLDLAPELPLARDATLSLPLLDGSRLLGRVNLPQTEPDGRTLVGGALIDAEGRELGSFSLGREGGLLGGVIVPATGDVAYTIEPDASGRVLLVERDRGAVLCPALPPASPPSSAPTNAAYATEAANAARAADEPAPAPALAIAAAEPVPLLYSRPGAPAVIYLDFDGETVTDPSWNSGNTIVASASGLGADQINQVWRRVAEDYAPFDVDVTTDPARYAAVAAKYRMRCIVTQTSAWFGTAGGVAYVSSWRQAGSFSTSSTIPCWVFANQLGTNPRYIAEAVAHEVGHTLGLSHDGLENSSGTTTDDYYDGRGSGPTSWAPIMGVGYYVNLAQWSRGDYADGALFANNTEDDLALITSGSNHVAYLADDASASLASAPPLAQGDATTIDQPGLVERTGDADTYTFATGAGTVSFTLAADALGGLPDLDARLDLLDTAGNLIASADPTGSLRPALSASVPAGTYHLTLTAVGEGDPLLTGYSAYGSLGAYRITGTILAAPPIVAGGSLGAPVGVPLGYQISASGGPTGYAALGLPPGLSIDGATGLVSGTPTLAGAYSVTLRATNTAGTASATLALTITGSLPTALDNPTLNFASGGAALWQQETGLADATSGSAARAGSPGDGAESWIEFPISGPGTLAFSWKTSSEADHDRLRLLVNGVELDAISGEPGWTARSLVFEDEAARVVRFSYTKDASASAGADTAWLDAVSFTLAVDRILDAPGLAWTDGGNQAWTRDTTQSHAGGSSMRSGVVGNNQESWIELPLAGPGVLTFWWRVSSQTNGDRLRINLDGVEQANISGTSSATTTWSQRTLTLAAGEHRVRWRYTKNGSNSSGADAGWIDDLVYTRPPVIDASTPLRATVGVALDHPIDATNSPASYAATGLPAGLALDTASGRITGTPTTVGDHAVTLSATNAAGTGTALLTLRVVGPYTAWTEDSGLATEDPATAADATPDADPDGDGLPNLLEYAFALDPTAPDATSAGPAAAALPVAILATTPDAPEATPPAVEFAFTLPAGRAELTYTVETSADLVTWSPGHAYGAGTASTGDTNGLSTVELENTLAPDGSRHLRLRPAAPAVAVFLRVRVTAP